jgi:hypothetical protein
MNRRRPTFRKKLTRAQKDVWPAMMRGTVESEKLNEVDVEAWLKGEGE